jgi:signal transduction histidine kinase
VNAPPVASDSTSPFATGVVAARVPAAVWYVAGVLLLAAGYYAAGKASLALQYHGPVAAVWLPAGVGAATLYLAGLRWWPGVLLGDLLLADTAQPLGTALGLTAGNVADILVIALVLGRLLGPRGALDRVQAVFAVLAAIVAGALISATVAIAAVGLGGVIEAGDLPGFWRSWLLADASGSLVIIPLAIAWSQPSSGVWRARRAAERALMIAAVIALSAVALSGDLPLTYVVFPALIWAALRFGQRGATLAVAVAAGTAVWLSANDVGPFVQHSNTESALITQLYIAVAAVTTMCLAAVATQARRLAMEQAALRRVATLVAREAPAAELFAAVAEEVGRLLHADLARVLRYEGDREATIVAAWRQPDLHPVDEHLAVDGESVAARVLRSGTSARMDSYAGAPGALAAELRESGVRSAVGAPIVAEGRVWGVVIAATRHANPLPRDSELRIAEFTELAATAIANAHSREELAASRARVVAAGDEARRRIERNLHDGAQQRLVSLGLQLRLAGKTVPPEQPELAERLSETVKGISGVLEDLQEISRGLHPAILTRAGLEPALGALARRSAVPVELDVRIASRLPEPVEAAAYYVASEALANAAKHSRASRVDIHLRVRDGALLLAIRDDGVGGADASSGSGLIGLRDRVEAIGGTLEVESAAGAGTALRVTLPAA